MSGVWRFSSILLLVAVLAAGCSSTSPSAPANTGSGNSNSAAAPSGQPRRVTAVLRGNPFTLSEAINADGSGSVPGIQDLQELFHAGLGVEDDQGNLRPRLAEELPTVENGKWKVLPD